MDKDTLLADLGITSGNIVIRQQGVDITVNVDTTQIQTVSDFMNLLSQYGFDSEIDAEGRLAVTGTGDSSLSTVAGGSNILDVLGLTNWDMGTLTQTSDHLGDKETIVHETTLDTKLNELTDAAGNSLGITSGNIYVYQDGTRYLVNIDNNDTLQTLAAKLSQYGINMELSSDGNLYFEGNNNSYMTTDGISSGASNLLQKINVLNNWSERYDSTSDNLSYTVKVNNVVNDSTKLSDLQDASGNNLGITEGTFVIGNATFNITDTTTLANLISQINSSDEANATAYWDSIQGKFVIKSRTTGSALVNIEAGTSNFTDIMGYTNTTRDASGAVDSTKMNISTQSVGKNAMFTINGTAYTSASNTITSDISRIKGVTLNLKGLTEGESVTVTVERDKETLATAVSDIVDAYNELINNVDEAIAIGGQLHDQSLLKLIRNQLRTMMTATDAGTTIFRNLDAIGIKVDSASANNIATEGITELTFDKDKFIQAYEADQDAVKALLIGSDTNTGVFTKVETLIESTLKSVTGYFETADDSYRREIDSIDNKIEKQERALERYRAQLEAKFASMDILIANMQQQYSSFLVT